MTGAGSSGLKACSVFQLSGVLRVGWGVALKVGGWQ